MNNKKVLVTGSAGLIGSQAVRFFSEKGYDCIGIDNDMRRHFFGQGASTDWSLMLLESELSGYKHFNADIRDEKKMEEIFRENSFDVVVHTAAQPSHDWAAQHPLMDFGVNAGATLILLENFRKYCPEGVFVFTSSNKVYGDFVNKLSFMEMEKRYELEAHNPYYKGINESVSIDQCMHGLFGVSKVAADLLVQEYGRYFGLKTLTLRAGCLTGPLHAGTELHGFLAYLAKSVAEGKRYKIYGYKGKQVRDNMHSYDLVNAIYHFIQRPSCGAVYNIGGGRFSNISILEAIEKISRALGKSCDFEYFDKNRRGDHIWYISDISKFRMDYPDWSFTYDIDSIIEEICRFGHFNRASKVRI